MSTIYDFAHVCSAKPAAVIKPTTEHDLIQYVKSHPTACFCIAGGQYSHGGQTFQDDCHIIDMKDYRKIISLDYKLKQVTVQSGATWKNVIEYLDPFNLSVSEMQSYCNFTVGGAVSVNCHGRGMLYGTLADSIIKLKLLTVDGQIIHACRQTNHELFRAVIGGYGGIAIILEVTLHVVPNHPIERHIIKTACNQDTLGKFYREMKRDPAVVFYNGNIYPIREDEVVHIVWKYKKIQSLSQLTESDRTQISTHKKSGHYYGHMLLEQLLRRTWSFKILRAYWEPSQLETPAIVWKNYEMTYDVNQLQPLVKFPTTTILQEYFVPLGCISTFLEEFWAVMISQQINILNVSLRYVIATDIPLLNYIPTDVLGNQRDAIAIVLYINIGNNQWSLKFARKWTQQLIQFALDLGGTYYLPYLPFATPAQFRQAYPQLTIYKQIKQRYDPHNRLTSQFISKYITSPDP